MGKISTLPFLNWIDYNMCPTYQNPSWCLSCNQYCIISDILILKKYIKCFISADILCKFGLRSDISNDHYVWIYWGRRMRLHTKLIYEPSNSLSTVSTGSKLPAISCLHFGDGPNWKFHAIPRNEWHWFTNENPIHLFTEATPTGLHFLCQK